MVPSLNYLFFLSLSISIIKIILLECTVHAVKCLEILYTDKTKLTLLLLYCTVRLLFMAAGCWINIIGLADFFAKKYFRRFPLLLVD